MKNILSNRFATRGLLTLVSAAILSGCAAQSASSPSVAAPAAPIAKPQKLSTRGLESVLGLTASQLRQTFGKPRLDVSEANGRKLQFSGKACILDVYLYAPEGQKVAQATHVDARRSNGAEVDRAACVKALQR